MVVEQDYSLFLFFNRCTSYARSILITYDTAVVEYIVYVYIVPYPTIEMIQTLKSSRTSASFH